METPRERERERDREPAGEGEEKPHKGFALAAAAALTCQGRIDAPANLPRGHIGVAISTPLAERWLFVRSPRRPKALQKTREKCSDKEAIVCPQEHHLIPICPLSHLIR